MKIVLDRTKCTGLGICESMAPDFFEIDDSGALDLLHDTADESRRDEIEAAVASCPTEALSIVEG
ncbi:ferredoxin [Actinomycetes bacterium M1A6_2h]